MDELPLEIYEAIFDYLHLVDIARLRAVCKKFQSVVKEYRIRELQIGHFGDYGYKEGTIRNGLLSMPRNVKRTVLGEVLKFKRQFENLLDDQVGYTFERSFYDQLYEFKKARDHRKYLVTRIFLTSGLFNVRFLRSLICDLSRNAVGARDLNADCLNQFTKLKRLEIFVHRSYFGEKHLNIKWCLPELEVLILRNCWNVTIEIDAPKCQGFHYNGSKLSTFKFSTPESVKYLSLGRYDERAHVFKNIEHLEIFFPARLIDESFYSAFPLLKTFRVKFCRSLQTPKQIFQTKNRNEEKDVKLLFHGIHLITGRELDGSEDFFEDIFEDHGGNYDTDYYDNLEKFEYDSGQYRFPVLIENYDRLEEGLNFVRHLVFSERVAELFELNPRKFQRIFDNIGIVSSYIKIEKPELFFSLLSYYSELQYLTIKNSGLGQQWFDRLVVFKGLRRLTVVEERKINFSFINELPNIRDLNTNHDLDLNDEVQLDEWERKEPYFTIKMKTGRFSIFINHRKEKYLLKFIEPPENEKKFYCSESLIRHVDRLRDGVNDFQPKSSASNCSLS